MDYTQVEEKFQALKEQFKAGTLDEASFKAQLNELMVQDAQGHWWMIGYETGQWYVHDGSAWVRSDPPEKGQTKPNEPLSKLVEIQTAPEPAAQQSAQTEQPSTVQSAVQEPGQAKQLQGVTQEAQAFTQAPKAPAPKAKIKEPAEQALVKPAGFIPNRGREALIILLGGVLYGGPVIFERYVLLLFITAPILPLAGIFFGPWVGGLAGVLGGLITSITFISKGIFSPTEIPAFVVGGFLLGAIPALLVKDARNWKSVIYACLLAAGPAVIRYIVLSAGSIVLGAYFWEGLVNNLTYSLIPILIMVPLLARALIDWVRQRGWYWWDTKEPRIETLTDWKTIFTLGTVWGILWTLIYGLGRNLLDLSGSWMAYSLTCGLAAVLILRSVFPALGWGQSLLILTGWGLGFLVATDAFTNVVANAYKSPDFLIPLLILGIAGGAGLGVALKWARVFSQWSQALISAAVWTGGMIVFAFLSNLISDNDVSRLFYAGLLVGAVGTWGIFWQRPRSEPGS